ncbi:MAG TPA: N-acetylmuramoyl-L-alanine amidase [Verrucomicrobiae bacterium]|nr:N-acetylmuramoyl-L-alanine amidase [Verrucomicrobiae bacterium]
MNRFTVRIGSAALALLACLAPPARADAPLAVAYGAQTIRFTHVAASPQGIAVGVEDPGFAQLLQATGSILTWKPGQRYVMVTTGVPVVVSFAIGDRRYDVGPISLEAPFAPYLVGDEAYLPLDQLLGALDLAMHRDAAGAFLVPQLTTLDVRSRGTAVTIAAHAGAPLHPRIVAQSPSAITYEFDGVGTPLAGTRAVGSGGVKSLEIVQAGTPRDPKTLVTVALEPGASVQAPRATDERDVVLAYEGSGPAAPAEMPTPVPPPPPAGSAYAPAYPGPAGNAAPGPAAAAQPVPSGPATVTGVSVTPGSDGSTVAIAVTGNAQFEWHRLRDPDNRFWIDIKGAQLNGPALDENEPDPIVSVRVRQIDPQTVRVAISLAGSKQLDVSPTASGIDISIGNEEVADAPRAGSGSIGSVVAVSESAMPITPAPLGEPGTAADASWKFGARSTYVPTNPRLIVIDPGHGGSDRGSSRNGTDEAVIALDIAKRLRDLLLAQGWQVKLTHDTDVDVYAPDDTAHQELQARVDVANDAGARLFVSIHCNAFYNAGPRGTTLYISKDIDRPLAEAIEQQTEMDGTKNDGIVKSHLYVTLHTEMPATLIETAFLSNPDDYALIVSPAWRQKIAGEIAAGIGAYAQAYPVPNQPPQ